MQLTRAQLQRSLEVVAQLTELRTLDEYPAGVAKLLRELIECDLTSYTAVDLASGRVTIAADPAETVFAGGEQVFAQFAAQNPLVAHYAHTGDGQALRISDFISRRELRRTDLYEHVYRQVGIEYQMAITLPLLAPPRERPQAMVGLTLSRMQRDFDGAEQQLLNLLRPHLTGALARLQDLALTSALDAGEDEQTAWVVLIDRGGTIALCSQAAVRDLGLRAGDPLPPALRAWTRQVRPSLRGSVRRSEARAATIKLGTRQVHVQLRAAVHGELDLLRLRPLGDPPSARQLRALGLTTRQADVLALLLRGQSSPDIARTLALSPRTVEKHLEAIYGRLGVSSRSQAIVHALRVVS